MPAARRYGIWDAIESLRPGSENTYCYSSDMDPKFSEWDTSKFGNPPTQDEIDAEVIRLNTEVYPIEHLRHVRNNLLQETDWMANSDVTMSDAWKTYRQALRDLPANTSDPSNPTWPTKPS
tara:strand:- start:500 stop:862 length:363 start_codon:yes stop_codon:yes gene_type:complete